MIAASRKVTVTVGGCAYSLVTDESDELLALASARVNHLLTSIAGHADPARRDAFVMLQLALEIIRLEQASAVHAARLEKLAGAVAECADTCSVQG